MVALCRLRIVGVGGLLADFIFFIRELLAWELGADMDLLSCGHPPLPTTVGATYV
jgi:hypothetical protein